MAKTDFLKTALALPEGRVRVCGLVAAVDVVAGALVVKDEGTVIQSKMGTRARDHTQIKGDSYVCQRWGRQDGKHNGKARLKRVTKKIVNSLSTCSVPACSKYSMAD